MVASFSANLEPQSNFLAAADASGYILKYKKIRRHSEYVPNYVLMYCFQVVLNS